jgi:hypothetical protein
VNQRLLSARQPYAVIPVNRSETSKISTYRAPCVSDPPENREKTAAVMHNNKIDNPYEIPGIMGTNIKGYPYLQQIPLSITS